MLLSPSFRKAMAYPATKVVFYENSIRVSMWGKLFFFQDLVHTQQHHFWKHYRNNRLQTLNEQVAKEKSEKGSTSSSSVNETTSFSGSDNKSVRREASEENGFHVIMDEFDDGGETLWPSTVDRNFWFFPSSLFPWVFCCFLPLYSMLYAIPKL